MRNVHKVHYSRPPYTTSFQGSLSPRSRAREEKERGVERSTLGTRLLLPVESSWRLVPHTLRPFHGPCHKKTRESEWVSITTRTETLIIFSIPCFTRPKYLEFTNVAFGSIFEWQLFGFLELNKTNQHPNYKWPDVIHGLGQQLVLFTAGTCYDC